MTFLNPQRSKNVIKTRVLGIFPELRVIFFSEKKSCKKLVKVCLFQATQCSTRFDLTIFFYRIFVFFFEPLGLRTLVGVGGVGMINL